MSVESGAVVNRPNPRTIPVPRPIILVTGGRDYGDRLTIATVLTLIDPGLVIQGGARGADEMARSWAVTNGVHVCEVPALWDNYGKAAGHKRNAVMVELCARLGGSIVAFPGGTGTASCVALARAKGLDVRVIE